MRKLVTLLLVFATLASHAQSVDGALKTLTATGTNTYSITEPLPATYSSKERFLVRFTNANTGTSTLNRSGLGAKDIRKADGSTLAIGDILAGGTYLLSYNGTYYQIVGDGGSGGGGGGEPLFTAFKADLDLLAGIIVGDGLGGYSSVTDNSTNWNTAFGWGDHAGLYADIFTASQGLTLSAGSLTFGGTISSDRSITSSTPLDFGLDFIDLHHFLVNTGSSMRLIGDTDVVFGVTSGGGMQIGHEAVTIGSASRIINLDATGISLKTGTALTATPKAIYYNDASGYLTELPIGTNGQILTVTSGTPAWETPVGGGLTYAQVKAIGFKK